MMYENGDYILDKHGIIRKVCYYDYDYDFITVYCCERFYSPNEVTKVRLLSDNKLNRKLYKDRIIRVENNKIIVRL